MKLFILLALLSLQSGFKAGQLTNQRVKQAYKDKENLVKKDLHQKGVDISNCEVFFRAFKKEQLFEVWAKNKADEKFKLIKTYPFCSFSGNLGPKRKQGDLMVPEGFYHIDRFNPWSNFYLSLGLNYPNASDRILGTKGALGGDIFIHGSCVTVGCIPLTDDKIKEVYIYAVEARNQGQDKIPVHLFPSRLDAAGWAGLKESVTDIKLQSFWENLRPGFEYFEREGKLPSIKVNPEGKYTFNL